MATWLALAIDALCIYIFTRDGHPASTTEWIVMGVLSVVGLYMIIVDIFDYGFGETLVCGLAMVGVGALEGLGLGLLQGNHWYGAILVIVGVLVLLKLAQSD